MSDTLQTQILAEFNKGEKRPAILKIKKYLLINPKDIQARLNLAYMYININLIDQAVIEYKYILKIDRNLQAMFSLAICYANQKRFDDSKRFLQKIINIDKNYFKAYRALGDIYFSLNDAEKACKYLYLAKQLSPNDPTLLNILGTAEMKRGNYNYAEKYLLESIKNKANYKNAYNNLAALYQKMGENKKSIKIFYQLLADSPKDQRLLNNMGNVLIDLNRYKDAIYYLKRAIKIDSSDASFYSNLGRALFFSEKYKDAGVILKKSLALNSKLYEAQLMFFYLSIVKKDLKRAWIYFDARLAVKNYFVPKNLNLFGDIKNKKILILREAGLGDEILFSSMYSDLIKKNNNVTIECDQRLKNIFLRSFKYEKFITKSSTSRKSLNINKYNTSIYAGSLSSIFRKKISAFNYKFFLKPNEKYAEYYKKKLSKINNLPKIGISWISARLDIGKDKSIELTELLPILKRKNLSFINLQYGDHSKSINDFNNKNNLNIIDIPELDKFKNIDKLLALISSLDLVITVSNTTAHLSGSIGQKTLLLAPDNRAELFYWMFSKDKTPWYPSIQIFRKNKNWKEALNNIQLNINKLFKNYSEL